jgi:hypothetical protein
VGIVGILLLALLVFGISSCVRGCTSTQQTEATETEKEKDTSPVNEKDERVAFGVDAELTSKFSQVLDRNDDFAYLAAHADMIEDQRLIDLALTEPEAVSFVAGAVDATGSTQAFGASVPQGEYPKLYTFDKRWGYAPYADGTIGAVGSGPVALAMASMGLTGSTAQDPVAMAAAVSAANVANGATGMDDDFLLNHANDVGLAAAVAEAIESLTGIRGLTNPSQNYSVDSPYGNVLYCAVIDGETDRVVHFVNETPTFASHPEENSYVSELLHKLLKEFVR